MLSLTVHFQCVRFIDDCFACNHATVDAKYNGVTTPCRTMIKVLIRLPTFTTMCSENTGVSYVPCQPLEHDQLGPEHKCNQKHKSSKIRRNLVYYSCNDAYSQGLSAMTLPHEPVDLVLVSDGLCPREFIQTPLAIKSSKSTGLCTTMRKCPLVMNRHCVDVNGTV